MYKATVPTSFFSLFMALKEQKEFPRKTQLTRTLTSTDMFSMQQEGFKKVKCVLTLTSSASECLQCSLNLGNTLSLRALRSTTLSVHNTNRMHLNKNSNDTRKHDTI